MNGIDFQEAVRKAKVAMGNSYSPYSDFKVGAALILENGEIYTGCNVENASYGLTNCAERTAVFKAVSEGRTDFKSILILSEPDIFTPPCGACRQVLAEFDKENKLEVILYSKGEFKKFLLAELLPYKFE